jgi:putative transposase
MKTRFTDEQIIQMIKEQEAGEKTADVCRRYGISQGTFYKYKSKYGGMEPSDAKKLRAVAAVLRIVFSLVFSVFSGFKKTH